MNIQQVKQRFGIIGRSPGLERALDTAIRVASTDLSVLITGESGVGKEAFSKIIHSLSARKHNPFIAINCGAIPSGTINSELFGHEKGAFTGATSDRKGYFETVNGGTIFLDEIGEMPLDTQSFLLRVLESGEYIRVGSSKVLKTDVRVIAATNISLESAIRKGKFREDLYYRLNTVPIFVPPLRDRREDIHLLFRKFAADFSERYRTPAVRLDDSARMLVEQYSWPGNIRELKNVVEQLSVLSREEFITADELIQWIPNITKRNLPALQKQEDQEASGSFREREILYKLLFDMKHDLNDLKSLVFEMINKNNLEVGDIGRLNPGPSGPVSPVSEMEDRESRWTYSPDVETRREPEVRHPAKPQPIILHSGNESEEYDPMEEVEENLSIEDMEKELIKKALKKHQGRRKDAAEELGISERTLYRKIKQYDL